MTKPTFAEKHAENIYTQFGEDGLLREACRVLGIHDGLVVEFGAGDGLELSNTARFWRDEGFEAILIEPDADRFRALLANTEGYPVARYNVAIDPHDTSIDSIVGHQPVAFMSVDVDDCEWHILSTMKCRPTLLLVEFNHTMPHHIELVGAPGTRLQASPLAIVRQAHRMGYDLLAITGCNCLFVRSLAAPYFARYDTEYEHLVNPAALTYMVTDWLGNYLHVGPAPFGMTAPYEDPQWTIGP